MDHRTVRSFALQDQSGRIPLDNPSGQIIPAGHHFIEPCRQRILVSFDAQAEILS
jgi:hypothetical protein